ncbi:MAG: hypothetical protein ACRCTR_03490 [Actinomycetota bacterium]
MTETTSPPHAAQRTTLIIAVLIALYGVLSLAATARSTVQIMTQFDQAPLAYGLSAAAGATYLAVSWALRRERHRWALHACSIELVGVLTVGTWSALDPTRFPDETVWSGYGIGYGFLPLILPVFTLWWLRKNNPTPCPSHPYHCES